MNELIRICVKYSYYSYNWHEMSAQHKAKIAEQQVGVKISPIQKLYSKSSSFYKEAKFKIYAIPKTTNIRLFTANEKQPCTISMGGQNPSLIYFLLTDI